VKERFPTERDNISTIFHRICEPLQEAICYSNGKKNFVATALLEQAGCILDESEKILKGRDA
jgi:hypothetical protein